MAPINSTHCPPKGIMATKLCKAPSNFIQLNNFGKMNHFGEQLHHFSTILWTTLQTVDRGIPKISAVAL
ncbi:hypothetical protein WMY93_034209 [Mugilogobius chulae]|uniref:Uncharacterized protein n=1 Tax=Mugilogobius chulae TaxID=88201 RepID=A0AAW0MFB6_9GOBI